MSIHYVAGHNVDQGESFSWELSNGILKESIIPMLRKIFKSHQKMLDVPLSESYNTELVMERKISFYNKVSDEYLLIYFPIVETVPMDFYRDENGAYCHRGVETIDIEVPVYEIREILREHYPHVKDLDKFTANVLKGHDDNTYWHNDYYGHSTTYAYIKIKKDADISTYL